MHTHFSVLAALSAFFSVLVLGTFWRLTAMHFVASKHPKLQKIGQGMLVQY